MTRQRVVKRTLAAGLALGLLLTLVVDLAVLVVPIYDMQLYDRVLMSRNMSTLTMLSAACVVGLIFYFAFDFLRGAGFAAVARRVGQELESPVLIEGIRRAAAGDRQAGPQLTRDALELQSFLSSGALAVPLDALCSFLFVALLFLLHPAFGWLALTGISGLVLVNLITTQSIGSGLRAAQEQRRSADFHLARSVAEADLVDGLGMLPAIARRWARRSAQALITTNRVGARAQTLAAISKLFRLALQAGVMSIGAILIVRGHTTPGSLMGANLLLNKCLGPFDHLVDSCRSWCAAHNAWRRMSALLSTFDQPAGMQTTKTEGLVAAGVGLCSTEGRTLLEDIHFDLSPGTFALLSGPNGSGKTTLLRLLAGLCPSSTGSITLDGAPIHGGPQIGYLPQSVSLLSVDVAQNIGRLQPELDMVVTVARRAGLHELIGRLPRGYETPLTGDGALLSGGMRQRLGLARALYNTPRLLLLDEPDANLDAAGCDGLLAALRDACSEGAIAVVISHRPALRQHADIVLEMKSGRLTVASAINAPVTTRLVTA